MTSSTLDARLYEAIRDALRETDSARIAADVAVIADYTGSLTRAAQADKAPTVLGALEGWGHVHA